MSYHPGRFLAVGVLSLLAVAPSWAAETMVSNPFYKFWAAFKPGARVVRLERTKLSGPEGKLVPGGVDEKRIVYKLIRVDKNRAVVEMVVTEQDFLGSIQAAPTRHTYPAKLEKSRLERIYLEDGGKTGEDTVEVKGKKIKTKTVSGTIKGQDGEQIQFKLWLSDKVPGMIVKEVRTARKKSDVLAETTTTTQSYKKGE